MLWVYFTVAMLIAVGTIFMVGIKGAMELYAPVKAAKMNGQKGNTDSDKV